MREISFGAKEDSVAFRMEDSPDARVEDERNYDFWRKCLESPQRP